jgi:hypothetical protein
MKRRILVRSAIVLVPAITLLGACVVKPAPETKSPAPVPGAQFTATFETASDFFNRFDRYMMSGGNAPISQDWMADHSMACEAPPTERRVHGGGIHSGQNADHLFFFCAPGGDRTKGHIMSTVHTGGVADLSFSPKPAFRDIRRVCWDVNTTWLTSRKWNNVLVVPAAAVTANRGRLDFLTSEDMGLAANAGLPMPAGSVRVKEFFGFAEVEVHGGGFYAVFGNFLRDVDKATRYRHCLQEVSSTQLRLTIDRPPGVADINETFPGQFPPGDVRVIFQDASYDAPKGEVLPNLQGNFNTWHWDNISIS